MLGDRIKKERLSHKLSQTQLAKMLHVTQGAISQWENNSTRPDMELLSKLALLFNCSVDFLLGNTSTRIDDDLLDEVNAIPDELLEKYGNVLEAKKALYEESTPEERELILIFRNLNNIGQSILLGTARGLDANTEMRKDGESNTMTTA